MDPMTLGIFGAGALLGGVVIGAIGLVAIAALTEDILVLEKSNRELQREVREAKNREIKLRFERMQMAMAWCQERLRTLMQVPNTRLSVLQRVWASGKALESVRRSMPKDGVLGPADAAFVDALLRLNHGESILPSEVLRIDEYLARKVPDAMRAFLEDWLSRLLNDKQLELGALLKSDADLRRETRALEERQRIEGADPDRARALVSVRSRLERLPITIEATRAAVDDLRTNLVVAVRLSRPDADTESDDFARGIMELLVGGHELTPADRDFLTHYRNAHFSTARERLKRERQIDLVGMGVGA